MFFTTFFLAAFGDAQNLRHHKHTTTVKNDVTNVVNNIPPVKDDETHAISSSISVNRLSNQETPRSVSESPPINRLKKLSDRKSHPPKHSKTHAVNKKIPVNPAKNLQMEDFGVADKKATAHRKRQQLTAYLQGRRNQMKVRATTVTDSGQIIDWVDPLTQLREGAILAMPPPALTTHETTWVSTSNVTDDDMLADDFLFELQRQAHARGPENTVPVLRRDTLVGLLTDDQLPNSVEDFLSKYGDKNDIPQGHYAGKKKQGNKMNNATQHHPHRNLQTGAAVHKYVSTDEEVANFGGQAIINIWGPYVWEYAEFSLAQVAVVGGTTTQTVECGWQVSQQIYGDSYPHLFTYFTTNGYKLTGDDLGGYNLDVAGFVQVSTTIFPGARISHVSKYGGSQATMPVMVMLYQNNWWVSVSSSWIGYYPAQLYASETDGLVSGATDISWYGEIVDNTDGQPTRTWMGSGQFASRGYHQAAFFRNIETYHIDCNCTENFAPQYYDVTNSNCYSYAPFFHKRGGRKRWGSYFFFGGPGADNNTNCNQE